MVKKKDEKQINWVAANPPVKKWLQELERRSQATARTRKYHAYHYFQWLKENKEIESAKQLLQHYKYLKKDGREYEHNDWAKEYLLNEANREKSYSWREGGLSTIRDFYRYNRCPLPDERIDLRVREIDAQRVREAAALKPMTLNDFRKLIGPAKIRERSELLAMLQSGMGVGELIHQFNVCTCRPETVKKHGHICVPANVLRQLREGKHPIKIEPLIAFKRNSNDKRVTYFTFIGKDAIDALKQYLVFRKELVTNSLRKLHHLESKEKRGHYLHQWEKKRLNLLRERLKEVTPELRAGEPIYISNLLNPIGEHSIQTPVRILKKQTGLLDRQFTPHTCRDLFKTECDHSGVKDNISEFWIRHALDKYGYNQLDKLYPEDFAKEYAKVEPALNVISRAGKETVSPDEIRELREQVRALQDFKEKTETQLLRDLEVLTQLPPEHAKTYLQLWKKALKERT